jgi:regulator of nonsense transcripts 2
MDVEFMLTDSIEAVRPKLEMPKTLEAAAIAVDDMFSAALQAAGKSYLQRAYDEP